MNGRHRDYWFLLYDGDGIADRKGVLVARERSDGNYDGYWSFDPAVVDEAVELAEARSLEPF